MADAISYLQEHEMINLRDLTIEELKDFLVQLGEKPFRAKQIFSWIYKGVESFDDTLHCVLANR